MNFVFHGGKGRDSFSSQKKVEGGKYVRVTLEKGKESSKRKSLQSTEKGRLL